MREIHEIIEQPLYRTGSWQLYMENLSVAVLDIETTGLSPLRDLLILGGLIRQEDEPNHSGNHSQGRSQNRILSQYLAASPGEEQPVLAQYLSELEKADVWVSYNGDAFDYPFLSKRLQCCGAGQDLPLHQSLDLFRIFRRYSPLAERLPDLRQTTVEAALGLSDHRADTLTGKESAALYQRYAKTGDPKAEQAILLHNHDDLLLLDRLLIMFDKLDLHRIMFERGFLIKSGEKKFLIQSIRTEKKRVCLSGRSAGLASDSDLYRDGYHFTHSAKERSFHLEIPCIREYGAVFFDLETLALGTDPLAVYPSVINGYLLLSDGNTVFYRSANHLFKLLLTEILKEM